MFLCLVFFLFLFFVPELSYEEGKKHECANHPAVILFAVSPSVTQSTRTLQWILHNFLICPRKPQNPQRPLTLNQTQRTTQVTHIVCLYTHKRFISWQPCGLLSNCFYFSRFFLLKKKNPGKLNWKILANFFNDLSISTVSPFPQYFSSLHACILAYIALN